jgi:HK97 gp10 family phage protein
MERIMIKLKINTARLQKRLRKLPANLQTELIRSSEQGAQEIVDMQKRQVPVRTGKLRDSIKWTRDRKSPLAITITAGDDETKYARDVEFGTVPHIVEGRFAGAQHPGTPRVAFFFGSYRALKKTFKTKQRRAVRKAVRTP